MYCQHFQLTSKALGCEDKVKKEKDDEVKFLCAKSEEPRGT